MDGGTLDLVENRKSFAGTKPLSERSGQFHDFVACVGSELFQQPGVFRVEQDIGFAAFAVVVAVGDSLQMGVFCGVRVDFYEVLEILVVSPYLLGWVGDTLVSATGKRIYQIVIINILFDIEVPVAFRRADSFVFPLLHFDMDHMVVVVASASIEHAVDTLLAVRNFIFHGHVCALYSG